MAHETNREDELGAATIHLEARGESFEGKIAVGRVIRERMKKKYSSDGTVEGTVLKPFQFSAWNLNDVNRKNLPVDRILKGLHTNKDFEESRRAWEKAKEFDKEDFAVLYRAKDPIMKRLGLPTPKWEGAPSVKRVGEIGNHIFFNDENK